MSNTLQQQDNKFVRGEVILIDKPLHWTSFDAVNKLRYEICRKYGFKKLKVGHAGTLDPLATGLVIICTGKKTKSIDLYQAQEKEYVATIELGATTPSYDLETEIDARFPTEHIDLELVQNALKSFEGEIDQVPPVFSAVSVNGKRAYKKARKGQEVELKARKVFIKELELLDFSKPKIELRIVCSKGTYIRSLAYDMGKALNSGAHLTALRRTRVGEFHVEQSFSVDSFLEQLSAME